MLWLIGMEGCNFEKMIILGHLEFAKQDDRAHVSNNNNR